MHIAIGIIIIYKHEMSNTEQTSQNFIFTFNLLVTLAVT